MSADEGKEAAYQETIECIYDLHENQKGRGYKGVHIKRVRSHQPDTG